MVRTLEDLTFDNRFTDDLPGEPLGDNRPRQVLHAAYSRVEPAATSAPSLLAYSPEVLHDLGLTPDVTDDETFVDIVSGNATLAPMVPHAACYGGHQFGNWAGQLGDGRAITLGEVETEDGILELQLKGAGLTPYSRTADGKAVLRSSIREFLCSEAMHHLGVPTTRALSLVTTGEAVVRDILYNGNPAPEPGAVVCRVAPSFIRFGSFQIHVSDGHHETLRTLVDHTVRHHFPHHDASTDDGLIVADRGG